MAGTAFLGWDNGILGTHQLEILTAEVGGAALGAGPGTVKP